MTNLTIVLYEGFTALDAVGPYEVLSRMPDTRTRFVSAYGGLVYADSGALRIDTEAMARDESSNDIVLVPGGPGDEAAASDARLLAWLRQAHRQTRWTTSVCTGSIVLAAAGLLEGLEATTHWAARGRLAARGAIPVERRVVRAGKIVTAAGVSAGIDMALSLVAEEVGEDYAKALQLGIEYDPQPPFDCGSPKKAPAHIVEIVAEVAGRRRARAGS